MLQQLLLVLIAVALSTTQSNLDCANSEVGYTLPCNQDLDPWKSTRAKLDTLIDESETSDDAEIWSGVQDAKEKVELISDTSDKLAGVAEATADALNENGEAAADLADEVARKILESAAKKTDDVIDIVTDASKLLKAGANALKVLASAAQFIGPILDIILLFAPVSKSEELKAIESGFAKLGARTDAVAYKLDNVEDALDWNAVVSILIEFEGKVNHITKKYEKLVEAIKATDPSRELPIKVKGQIEDLVEAIKNSGGIGNSLELVDNLFRGNSGFTKGKYLLEMFVDAVDNDCSNILPMAHKLIAVVKNAQRLQYFYEINQQLINPNDDKGYPKMVHDMYISSMAEYRKCTKNAAFYAQQEMEVLYNDEGHGALTNIIDKMESKYDLYNWATMKENDKEEEEFALVNRANKLDVQLTAISDDEKEKQRLTLFAVRKCSKTLVEDTVRRIKNVLVSLENTDRPTFKQNENWSKNQQFRQEVLGKVQNLLKTDDVLKSLMENQQLTMVMFQNGSNIDLTGWHFKTDFKVVKMVPANTGYRGAITYVGTYPTFTIGFLFNFKDDPSSLKCSNGNLWDLTVDGSLFYCLCDMGYGGQACNVSLKESRDSKSSLSSSVLEMIENYKVPGMFDLQEEIKKGTTEILQEMGNNKQEIFSQIQKTGHDVEKGKNAILSAQSLMLEELKTESVKVLNGLSGLQAAINAAFENERNDRIYRTEEGKKVVMKAISDSNKVVTDSIKQLTGKVVENRYFKELKLYVPVYQEQFQKAIDYGDFAEQEFSDYLNCHKLPLQAAKEAAKKAIVETSDSFLMAQMQINMVSGCTEVYTEKIKSTWAQLMEVHLALTTMELWDLDFKMKKSSDQFEKAYLSYEKAELEKNTISDTVEFKEILRTRSCPEFSLPELLGGGCGPSITFPGQTVPMKCTDQDKSLILLSSGQLVSEVLCKVDSTWAVNTANLTCVSKCRSDDKLYEIGERLKLPDAPDGFFFADEKGNEVTEKLCLAPQSSTSKETTVTEGLRGVWSVAEKTDKNECTVQDFCKFGGLCKNSEGSFSCSCLAGYTVGDDGKCEDVNECTRDGEGHKKCLVQDQLGTCQNRDGSYDCSCLAGSYTTPDHGGKKCVACNCNLNGVTSKVCNRDTGACLCNPNVGGVDCGHCMTGYTNYPYCTKCAAGYYGYPNCKKCNCNGSGVTAQQCNPYTGTCECKTNVAGSQCSHCAPHYSPFPSCNPVVRHGTMSNWGAWSGWHNHGSCGHVTSYLQERTRTRRCDDSTKNIHGTSCAGQSEIDKQTRVQDVCKYVTGVFIYLPDRYWAPTTGNLWMGIRQGHIHCTTHNPTWRSPSDRNKAYVQHGTQGCTTTFDWTKPVDLHLYSDSSNDVYITMMGVYLGGRAKAWRSHSSEGYASIDKNNNVGWCRAN